MPPTDLRLGLFACQQTLDDDHRVRLVDEMAAEARAAETAGFRGVFVSEHHQRADNYFPSPLILAAVLARETRTVDVGVAIAILPLYHPLRLIEDATCVDVASNGRLILGLGPGYVDDDFRLYGVDRTEAMARYEEALELVAKGWDAGVRHDGTWFRADIREIRPRPVSSPHPRLWLAGASRKAVRLAARMGAGWVVGTRTSLPRAAALAREYRDACGEAAVEPEVAVMRDAWVGETRDDAFAQIGPALIPSYRARAEAGLLRDEALARAVTRDVGAEAFLELSEDWWIVGDAEEVRRRIGRWRDETGMSYLICRFRHPQGPSHEAVMGQIGAFGAVSAA